MGTLQLFTILSFSILLISFLVSNAQPNTTTFQVGVILDFDSLVGRIGLTTLSLAASDFYSINRNYSTRLELHVRDSRAQITAAAASALNLIKDTQVDAIIGPQKSSQANFVIGLGDSAKVPIISFSATSPSLNPRTPYFVQTALNDAAQVEAIAAVVKYFSWSQVVLVYEDSDYGNGIIPYLSNAFQEVNARVSYRSIIPVSATDDYILKELYKMKTMQTRVFVVHVSSSLAPKLFPRIKEAEMMSEGYVWIVTSGLMDLFYSLDPKVVESMRGVIGVKPMVPRSRDYNSTNEKWKEKFSQDHPGVSKAEMGLFGLWAYDTFWALAMAAEKVGFRNLTTLQNTTALNSTNMFVTEISQTGPKLLEAMLENTFQGLGGNFHLVNGQLEPSSFQILNVVGNKTREVGIWTLSTRILSAGENYNATNKNLTSITWPGGNSVFVPKGWEFPLSGKKLIVGVPESDAFPEFVKVERDPQTNAPKFSGYIIDLFDSVLKELPYALRYDYVPFETRSSGSYDNLTLQVSHGVYDIAVGDITITEYRSQFVDFTLPIEEGGVTRTQKIQYENPNDELIFLKPLTKELWLTAIALFFSTGVALWVLEHRLNRDFRGPFPQNAGLILYVPFMSLVFANRERIVSNLARLVLVVWVFVVLILSSTYTASLSARLTARKLQQLNTNIRVLIRNGDYVGCRQSSFIVEYLKNLGFDKSKIRTYNNSEDFDDALYKGSEKGGIKAYFSRTPHADVFLSKYCNKYTKVGSPYPTQGFAFVFPKGSPLVSDVSRAIIKLTDNHKKSEIKDQWIHSACDEDGPDASNAESESIDINSFKILFGVTGGITATCLVIFLVCYFYQNKDSIQTILSDSNTTTWSKIRAICKHFDERDPNMINPSNRADEDENAPLNNQNGAAIDENAPPNNQNGAVIDENAPSNNQSGVVNRNTDNTPSRAPIQIRTLQKMKTI